MCTFHGVAEIEVPGILTCDKEITQLEAIKELAGFKVIAIKAEDVMHIRDPIPIMSKERLKLNPVAEWPIVRRFILDRDNYTCVKCGRGKGHVNLLVHHIVPWRDGGRNTNDNLITLCSLCHGTAHSEIEANRAKA
jgi:hypothetical protein